ncbi:type I glyceraldehyde-3-phosphate dehydrogenase [Devosia neptuniae]|jgi:glyceraldehyde 3-phosphate dehydrogenase|uniref:type I glyceraldehyde-3-phosphate dehydrogenase n=1 Tax=Devosia TaxID=46913 RepID=UPI0022B05B9F|nr:type I glyceraldehyde-3-phosphate dehydrogenase [Devosia neptuniae]MCZ4346603.1 type I glyceraldehyde-3-phosphate dehydrogenase [Devosia neptuniae]|tara:strand:+ start:6125 stop:7132 length:1008 start_codon:yes stop_codon:yes gene_type:complete
MAVRVAINGFGRIGRNVLRAIMESGRTDIEVVAINDLGPVETNAHLFRFDSVHGRYNGTVTVDGDTIDVGRGPIKVTAVRDPAELPHADLRVDIALECTGIFNSKEKASAHLKAGAKKVLISAPGDGADLTVVYGINHDQLTKDHIVVSNASCTTNCLAPVAYVLHKEFGIERGMMTTIHSYTGDQPTLDTMHKDLYRGRAAALSQIPTSTGAAKAIGLVLPELKGKLDGVSIRVPTPNVSCVDFKFITKRDVTAEEINAAVQKYAEGDLKGILGFTTQPNVSIDFNHDSHSSTLAFDQTKVMGGNFASILSWYDNEWGFSNRMADTAVAMAKTL